MLGGFEKGKAASGAIPRRENAPALLKREGVLGEKKVLTTKNRKPAKKATKPDLEKLTKGKRKKNEQRKREKEKKDKKK